jgi:hypothetical protein
MIRRDNAERRTAMKNGPAVTTILLLGGFLLGLVVYAIALTGLGLTAAALVYSRATVEAPATDMATAGGTTLEEEISAGLAGATLGGSATISEESVNRLLRIGVIQNVLPDNVTLHSLHLDLNPSAVLATATATIAPAGSVGRSRLEPQTTRFEVHLQVLPQGDGLLVVPEGAALGRLALPPAALQALSRRFNPETLGLPAVNAGEGALLLPYEALQSLIPSSLVLEGLVVREGYLVAQVTVSEELRRHLVSEAAPLIEENGQAVRDAATAALGVGNPVTRSIESLVAKISSPPAAPLGPTALVSYRERDVEATPPEGTPFSPAVGTDLVSGSLLRTGDASYVECILRDDTMLRIDQNTQVHLKELPSSPEDARGDFTLLNGRLRARVAAITGSDYQFAAGDNVCGVRGTDLIIHLFPDQNLLLSVLEGSVVLTSPEGTELPVAADQALRTAGGTAPAVLTPGDRQALESELLLRTEPEDAPGVREAAWLWQLLDEAKRLAMHLMTLDDVSQERLAAEVQSRIDIESLRPRLEEFLKELGVEDPIAWLESRS